MNQGRRRSKNASPEGSAWVEIREEDLSVPDTFAEDCHRQEGVDEILGIVEQVREGVPLHDLPGG